MCNIVDPKCGGRNEDRFLHKDGAHDHRGWLSAGMRLSPSAQAQTSQSSTSLNHVFLSNDFGYRIDTMRPGEAPNGTLVVQLDGL